MPTEIDEVERRIVQLEIERQALSKEKDKASRERLAKIEKELADLREQSAAAEGAVAAREGGDREGQADQGAASRRCASSWSRPRAQGDLDKAAELRYGTLPELESELQEEEQRAVADAGGKRMLKEEVDAEDIAEVVAKWTGIPVSKMLEGEVEKLLQHRGPPARARGRPGRGAHHRRQRRAPLARRPRRSQAGPSARSSSWGPPASARPSWRGRWPSSSSTTRRPWSAST